MQYGIAHLQCGIRNEGMMVEFNSCDEIIWRAVGNYFGTNEINGKFGTAGEDHGIFKASV